MTKNLIIIGISGVTCGGKTTIATELKEIIPSSLLISQDTYFFQDDDPRHTWIAELNHANYDIVSSLDMPKMCQDINKIIEQYDNVQFQCGKIIKSETYVNDNLQKAINNKLKEKNTKLLILEGFCIFNYKPVSDLCLLKYYFTLDKEECYRRRCSRVYDPPDCPGYFEKCAWPEYLNLSRYVRDNLSDVSYFDGDSKPLAKILTDILDVLTI